MPGKPKRPTLTERIDRLERATEEFQLAVRGAFTVQQDQIATLTGTVDTLAGTVDTLVGTVYKLAATVDKLAGTVDKLAATVQQHDALIANLLREWQAYLRRQPPQ